MTKQYTFTLKTDRVGIDPAHNYGYWECRDGSESGGLWFDEDDDGVLNLIDYDGNTHLPKAIITDLRTLGILVDADFE